ncbi:CAP domain-containing protein [Actinoplanes sp. TFC3]|uniref:CAP domain-containing protein n=1 Tax=Actinoplanes sp. TFC3 TaxID=1710355 RepID=UPI00082CA691|nr:CAP domain-containing protein [Actinoplanes sp. TFC3]
MFDFVRRIALAAAAPAALLAVTAVPAQAAPGGPAGAAAAAQPTTEQVLMAEVVALTNEQRVANGCGELAVDEELTIASVRQAHYMAATGDFGHIGWRGSTFESRAEAIGYDYVAAENVGWGYSGAAGVMDAWMASPGHRANILNCDVRSFGAGVQRAVNGTYYWAQVFGYR